MFRLELLLLLFLKNYTITVQAPYRDDVEKELRKKLRPESCLNIVGKN